VKRAIALCALAALTAFIPSGLFATPATVTIVEQPDAAADLGGVEVLLQAGLDRQTPRQNGLSALTAETILQTPVAGLSGSRPLQQAISENGGSITYAVEPRHIRFYVEGVGSSYARLLTLFHQALSKPDFSAPTLSAARVAVNEKIKQSQRLALSVGIDMLNGAFYQNSDAGMPPFGTPQTLASFSGTDVAEFYRAHYHRGDAVVSAIGNISGANGNFAFLVDGLQPGVTAPITVRKSSLPSSSRQIIARRDVPVPWLVAQYPAPEMRSRDFGAMLILTAFVQRTLADVSELPGIATRGAAQRGVGAFYNFDTYPANVIIYVDGGLGDPTRTFATALTVVNVLGHAKLSGDLSQMKSFAAGRFLEDTQTLQDRAWLAGVFAAQHQSGDYTAMILKAINDTNGADLQRVAARYLSVPTIALVLPRAQPSVQTQP
jgi:predicted Zn-dependent peptidase